MYNRFFGFKERPFKLVPNPEYLFLSRIHEEVLAHLNYAVGYGEGFVAITGEVGTGKTTLCRMFLENLDEKTAAAYIFNPKLDALQLLKAVNDEFGISTVDTNSLKNLIDRLNAFLLEKKARGHRVILLVDEAQNLAVDVLEQLRLLSNLETTTSKLIQIILVGQPELRELLNSNALRQLNQRINLSCHLVPLSFSETGEYIRHRIHIASRKPGLTFSEAAVRSIFKYSGGVPRLINIACDRSLLTAFTQGKRQISHSIARQAIGELDGKRRQWRTPLVWRRKPIFGSLALLVFLAAGFFVGQAVLNRTTGNAKAPVMQPKNASPPQPSTIAATTATGGQNTSAQAGAPPDLQPPLAELPALATAVPKALPATEIEAPPARTIEQVMASTDASNSRMAALKAVLEQWKIPQPSPPLSNDAVDAVDDVTFFRISAHRSGMEMIRVRGNLNLIRKLNLPAILEFPYPDGSGLRFMAVMGLNADSIQLSDGDGAFSIAPASLATLWNGVAHILWKNHYNYLGVIPISSPGEVILSLKVQLKALGFPVQQMTAVYDAETRLAVESIQARNGLTVDGMVGPLTKIVLYNEDRSLDIPRLTDAPIG